MGFELFVQCFEHGVSGGIPRQAIWDLFAADIWDSNPTLWRLRYDDSNSCDIFIAPPEPNVESVDGFMVSRPCGDRRLWDTLVQVMRLGPVVLFFPGSRPLVANEWAAKMLPADMIESLGEPLVIHSGVELLEVVGR